MWLGDISVGDDSGSTDTPAPATDNSNPLLRLAADLADSIHPYKSGVPLNVAISPQTQTFLTMGGVLIGGLLLLNIFKR